MKSADERIGPKGTSRMMKQGKWIAAVIALALGAGACAKMPEKLISPMLKIEPVVKDGKEAYRVMVSAGIQNENGDTAFLNVKGSVGFRNPENGTGVMTLPFTIPVILPFDTGVIEIDKTMEEPAVMPLVHLLGADKEKLNAEKGLERTSLDEKTVVLAIEHCEKKNILKLLRERGNEKHQ